MSDTLRITGLATGLDTESMIKKLMDAERMRVDKVEQDKQYTEWKIEEYRNIINEIRGLKDEFFNFTNSDTNIRSSSTFNSYNVSFNGADSSSYIDIEANKLSSLQDKNITDITKAESASIKGTDITNSTITTKDITGFQITGTDDNKLNVTLNGITKEISLNPTNNIADLELDLNTKLEEAFGDNIVGNGNDKVKVTNDGSSLSFQTDSTNILSISSVEGDSAFDNLITDANNVKISNKLDISANIEDLNIALNNSLINNNNVEFEIGRGSETYNFTFDATTNSIQDIINEVNNSDANVEMVYSQLDNSFEIKSKSTGELDDLSVTDVSGNLMTNLGLDGSATGTNSSITFDDGTVIERNDNNFSFDGMNFNIKSNHSGNMDISISNNPDKSIEVIEGFIEKYNSLIDKIDNELNEKIYRDYKPLTDEQKKDMTEKEIELWEEKSKSGLLRSESNLDSMLVRMRRSLYEEVEGAGINLRDLGITTSAAFRERGKLVISDRKKLNDALSNSSDKVMKLFTNESDNYGENGIANRLNNIMDDYIGTTGEKGILLKKAGIEGDRTQYDNYLNDRVKEYDERISDLMVDLSEKEDYYYNMFARMERAIQSMNQQSAWLNSQMGGGMM